MPRKRKASDIESKQKEILSSVVNPTGAGEDPAVKAMLSREFVEGTNREALEMALAFQKMLKGEASLVENDKFSQMLERITAKMDEMDRVAQKWEDDRQKFVEEMTRMADKLKVSEAAREQMEAKAAIDLQQKVAEARASITIDRQAFDDALAREPKVIVTSPGVVEMVNEGGAIVAKLYPEQVRIKHRVWTFVPGKSYEVPQSVGLALENRRKSQMETAERQEAMKANMESGKLAQRMKEIDLKYKSSTAHLGEPELTI